MLHRIADSVLAPLTFASSVLLKKIRKTGVSRMPVSRRIFNRVGVFPIQDHYYEPAFQPGAFARRPAGVRPLPGIDLNVREQLDLLDRFDFAAELGRFPLDKPTGDEPEFFYNNSWFESGDAEYLYSIIRHFRPARIIEVGSGNSTLLAREAIRRNTEIDPEYRCRHVCIEPYEHAWLERLGVEVVRERVEEVATEVFQELQANDVLFIDSSHVIRPQGDVLYEFMEVLPSLNTGVLVHVHDIFTPRDYPQDWLADHVLFWNEQYLLEAFLCFNSRFKVIGALNFLAHHHREQLAAKFPVYAQQAATREPRSFWMVRSSNTAPHSG